MATVYIAPTFGVGFQAFDAAGVPLNAGLLYSYSAGTTTPLATYTASDGVTPNANPIVLGADGRPPNEIWMTAVSYRFDLKDSLGNTLASFDNVPSGFVSASTLAASTGAAGVGFVQSGTAPIARTVEAKLREMPRGVNDHDNFTDAVTSAVADSGLLKATKGTHDLSGITTIDVNVSTELLLVGDRDATLSALGTDFLLHPNDGSIIINGLTFDTWENVINSASSETAVVTPLLDVRDSEFTNLFDAILHYPQLSEGLIAWNRFHDLSGGVPIKVGINDHSIQDGYDNLRVIGNIAKNITQNSAIDHYFAQVDGQNGIIALNSADTINSSGAGETFGIYTKMRYAITLGNNMRNVSTTGSGNPAIYQIKGASRGDTLNGVEGYSNIVYGNIGLGTGGTTERGFEVHVEDAMLVGNLFENLEWGGTLAPITDGTHKLSALVALNKMIGRAKATGVYGLYANNTEEDALVLGNIIRQVERGVNSSGGGANLHVIGNNVADCSGIAYQQAGTQNLVTLVGNVAYGATRAFYLGGTITRLLAVANNWDGMTDTPDFSFQVDGGVKSGLVMANAPTELSTAVVGPTNLYRLSIPTNTHVYVEATVVAVKDDGSERGCWKIAGFFYNSAGTVTQEGTTDTILSHVSAWGGSPPTGPAFSPTGTTLRVQVSGIAGTIRWSINPTVQYLT